MEIAEHPAVSNELYRIETAVGLKPCSSAKRLGARICVRDHPNLACRVARAFGRWLGDLVAPIGAEIVSTELRNVRTGPGLEYRNRNGAATGKLSAQAEGLAIDIAGFDLANRSTLLLQLKEEAFKSALAAFRTAACGWFTTVLGPGSDAAHADY